MSLRILLVDDEAPARARLRDVLGDIVGVCPHQIVGEADHAQQALDRIAQTDPDLVLLDVQMPGMSGIELAAHLAKHVAHPPSVIFISAYDEFALKAFEVRALDYLLKPVRAERLADAINRIAGLRQTDAQRAAITAVAQQMATVRAHFAVQERGRLRLIPVADVLYLKAEAKYVTLRTASAEHLIEESLASLEHEMAQYFIRVHRNALVARHAIAGVERVRQTTEADVDGEHATETWQVIVRGIDQRLPISRRQWGMIKALVR